jgi:hypothetical protein
MARSLTAQEINTMTRTTEKLLELLIARINEIKHAPAKQYSESGANVGNYHLYICTGCYALDKMTNTSGGVTRIFSSNTKSGLETQLRAYIAGMTE